ncbi:MAG: pantoate--beta-alanine ligase [Acidimicrobiaceae bacterium]|nr:pantoate--beta-alanine ligase [Acidimicrobiaceae bacterium]
MTVPANRPVTEETIGGLRARLDEARSGGHRVGLVPTMGFLHAGHRSLIEHARSENDLVVVSIFVNPLQFNPGEDFDDYPRDLDHDLAVCARAGADIVFTPGQDEMYPEPVATTVRLGALADVLCGASRPGHFDGVATVVAKLFAIVGECSAYFGEKDFQQLTIVSRMAKDLSLPVSVVGCPTVREPDGLALSSRNAYLSEAERAQAPVLRRALEAGEALVEAGETDRAVVEARMTSVISDAPLATLDYAAAVSPTTLTRSQQPLQGDVRLLVAVRFGKARLIDNLGCRTG